MEVTDTLGDLKVAVEDIVSGSWKWAVFFHGCYWVCRFSAAYLFDTYGGLERDKRGYWCASMVSSFHAVLITTLSLKAFVMDHHLATGLDFFYHTQYSVQASRIFFGYIFSDLLLSIYYRARWPGWVENLMHHLFIMLTWGIFIGTKSGQFFACVAHICELTTPFVNQRWFLYEAGLKSGKVYFYNGLAMVFLWFITRIVLYGLCGVKMVFTLDQLSKLGYFRASAVLISYSTGLCLQVFWFYKIMRGAIKSVRGAKATKTKKVE